jgi:outer membrane receptor protein involved in Fe transport
MKRYTRKTARMGLKVLFALVLVGLFWPAPPADAQGVTTSSITGIVRDAQGLPIPGATIVAYHEPSGTTYEAVSLGDGRFSMPAMRVGGPYTVTASLGGFDTHTTRNVFLGLGVATDVSVTLGIAAVSEEVTVMGQADPVFSSERTGAGTAVSREAIATLPTISNRLESFVRLTPQAGANLSFAGQDNRLNNITVDGSYFNNSFGLAGQPGDRTGVAPISMAAIEAVQVNIAPYDVRQGNFVGAGVNTVTRSGGNNYHGSLYYMFRDQGLVGTKAAGADIDPGTFKYNNIGFWGAGPVVKNKLFFFGSFEDEGLTQPGTTFVANTGGQVVSGNTTRVLKSDLDTLGSFLGSKFNYEAGPYERYSHETPARRFLAKVDYNLNPRHKLSFRYNHLDSFTDVPLSNSSSLGFGTRRSVTTGLNFQNSNYKILENIRSFIGEWNSAIGMNKANTLIAGYTFQDESRDSRGEMFPFVDILDAGTVYTSFGFEPFTPNNELRYGTFQVQNNLTWMRSKHTWTFGASAERYKSENIFFPGAQSVYVYNSLADFYTDANDHLANPNRTTSPVTLRRFQVRWMNIPGMDKPVQPLQVWYTGLYAQDSWQAANNLKLTYGVRLDVPMFGDTGYQNENADALSFMDEKGATARYQTKKLPDASILWSPRLGFNWDVTGDRKTQVRGGTGIFTGRPAYVWISNQIGNTGVLTGFQAIDNTTTRPFHPDPNRYKPTSVTGAPASTYELALTDQNFKFPQVWRNSLAVDRRLPWGWTGTAELLYTRDVNGVYYINANLAAPNTQFVGVDARPRWTAGNRINTHVANAIVLKNQNVGSSWNVSGTLDRRFRDGFWTKFGYRYGESKNTVDPGSIAFGSWNNNQHSGNPNNPGLAFSAQSPGHRVFASGAYTFDYFRWGATTVSVFFEGYTQNNISYSFAGDINGDGGTSNDLIFIHRDISEMNFQTFTASGKTFTAAEQAAAWDAFIQQDPYLSKNRGNYAQRGAAFLPMLYRTDFAIYQDLFTQFFGKHHALQARFDILNFGNLLNSNWGVGRRFVTTQPLIVPTAAQGGAADASGRAQYRLRVINNELITKSLEKTAFLSDVYRIQFSIRYTFR